MPICVNCQTDLLKPIDEYGPRDATLCRTCFLEQDNRLIDPELEMKAIRDEIQEVNDLISAENMDIRRLRSKLERVTNIMPVVEEINDCENERDRLSEKRNNLQERLYRLLQAVKAERLKEQAKLIRWTEGVRP